MSDAFGATVIAAPVSWRREDCSSILGRVSISVLWA